MAVVMLVEWQPTEARNVEPPMRGNYLTLLVVAEFEEAIGMAIVPLCRGNYLTLLAAGCGRRRQGRFWAGEVFDIAGEAIVRLAACECSWRSELGSIGYNRAGRILDG
jgi:hypothetical protein